METQKTEGIVVSVSRYRDADVLATILTENGLKKVKFVGVRKAKAKFAFAAQPFCHAEFLLSSSKDYAVVMGVEQKSDFFALTEDYDKFELAAGFLALAKKVATEEQDNSPLYNLLLLSLNLLVAGVDCELINIIFKARVLKILGLFTGASVCAKCGQKLETGALVDESTGAIYCKNCANLESKPISKNIIEFINNITYKNISEIIKLNISSGIIKQTKEIIDKLILNLI